MKRSLWLVVGFGILLLLTAVRPSQAYELSLGGVNLTGYCVGAFGDGFKAVTVGTGAGDWVCQNGADVHDRRPISVQDACKQQYSNYADHVRAHSGVGAGSWVCEVPLFEQGLDLTGYCSKHFGSTFVAKLIGTTTGDWVCEGGGDPHNLRSISMDEACREQYSHVGLYKALAKPPTTWVCLTLVK